MTLGDVFGVNCMKLKGHILTYIDNFMGDYVFYDLLDGNVLKIKNYEVKRFREIKTPHPMLGKIDAFEFVENLPKDVFDTIIANCNKKIKDAHYASLM